MEPTFRAGTTVLGKYRIESALGRDGMYVALRVSHPRFGELVLKMLLPETAISLSVHARFVRQAQAALRLRGEHVARLADVGISSDGVPYLVTEAVQGVELGAELARRGALIPAEAVDYVLQVCDALAEAHAHGVVHRRVRPASVLLTARPDGSLLIKLLDFGIIHMPPAASTPGSASSVVDPVPRADAAADQGMESTAYMAPEQIRAPDEVDGRADIWAVGAVLYECLTGQRPFAEPGSTSGRVAASAVPRPMDPQIPAGLQAAVLRCLEADREARFPSIAALAAALAPYAHDHRTAGFLVERANRLAQGVYDAVEPDAAPGLYQVGAVPPVLVPPEAAAGGTRSWTQRRYATIAVAALGVSIGGIATAALIRTGRSHDPIPTLAAKPIAGSASIAPNPTAAPAAASSAAATARQLAACAELQRAQRWQDLDGCATELAKLGASGKAEQLRATARQELQNEVLDGQARRALHDGNLPQAQAALQQIDPGSVYLAALRAAVAAAEQQRADEARRQAEPRADDRPAAPPPDRAAARPPAAPPAARSRKDSCDSVDTGELMTRAATQYDAGSPSAALSLARVALGCKQTDRMYWLAVMYACAARDLASAKLYFAKVPANLQAGIERRCQQGNLDVRTR